jgi:hypothetical protein
LIDENADGEVGDRKASRAQSEPETGANVGKHQRQHPTEHPERNHPAPPSTEQETNKQEGRYHATRLRLPVFSLAGRPLRLREVVPDVVGQSQCHAAALLRRAGLAFVVSGADGTYFPDRVGA